MVEIGHSVDKYVDFVEAEALRQTGMHFLIDTGEGRSMPDPPPELETDVEDLSGWLLTDEQWEKFLNGEYRTSLYGIPEIIYVFAEWRDDNGKLAIDFMEVCSDHSYRPCKR